MPHKATNDEIKSKILGWAADLVGIAPVERFKHAPKRLGPLDHLPDAQAVVAIGIHHPDATIERGGEPPAESIASYLWYQEVMNRKLSDIAFDISRYLEKLGYSALPIAPTNIWRFRPYKEIDTPFTQDFSNRHAAVAAGLGEFGWNGLVLTPQYGPRQRLVSVITNAPLKPDPMYEGEPLCDKCYECVKACPTGALPGDKKVEVSIGKRTFEYARLDKWRCAWSEHYGLVGSEGPLYFGATTDVKPPDEITPEALLQALQQKDPIQGHNGVMGKCLQVCLPPSLRVVDKGYSKVYRRKKY